MELFLDFEETNLLWVKGTDQAGALLKFEALEKHKQILKEPQVRNFYEAIQARRAFVLADLGQWKAALTILQEIESAQEMREGVAFYLGHCYLANEDYISAEQSLSKPFGLVVCPTHLSIVPTAN